MIKFTNNQKEIDQLNCLGFFVDWPDPPSPERLKEILKNSDCCWLAVDQQRLVGFVNLISDRVFYGFIPLLEVLPDYQNQGIAKKLIELMKESTKDLYAIDLVCDDQLSGFYEKSGFYKSTAMSIRNYQNQNAPDRKILK